MRGLCIASLNLWGPKGPAAMHYFNAHGRYLGYIVYPGRSVALRVQTQTLALMESLHVTS